MDNMLDDIEKVVDDFSLEEKKEEVKFNFKDFENRMLNERLKMVVEKQHQEAMERKLQEEYHKERALKHRLEEEYRREKALDYRLRDLELKHEQIRQKLTRKEVIECNCGKKMEVNYTEDYVYGVPLSENYEYSYERAQPYTRFFCAFCGLNWRLVGTIISIKNY